MTSFGDRLNYKSIVAQAFFSQRFPVPHYNFFKLTIVDGQRLVRGSGRPIGGSRGQQEGLRGQLEDLGASQKVWEASQGVWRVKLGRGT